MTEAETKTEPDKKLQRQTFRQIQR